MGAFCEENKMRRKNASKKKKKPHEIALWGLFCKDKKMKAKSTGEATPRGPQTIPIFRTQNQGTRSSLMKTTSARQNALAKLKRADRNVLDASQC